MRTRPLMLILLLAASAFIVVACGGGATDAESTPDPASVTIETPVGQAPAAAPTTDPFPGWETYVNAQAGFSFRYPSTWTLAEGPNLVQLSQGTKQFNIAYRLSSDTVQITGTGTAAGDFQSGGTATFLGQSFPINLLVQDDKVNTVYYGEANSEITAGNLVFSLSLVDSAPDLEAIEIPAAMQTEATQILSSFSLASGALADPPASAAAPAAAGGPGAVQPTVAPTADVAAAEPVQSGDCVDDSQFSADVTVPDGTVMEPGEAFIKTWRMVNNGTCTWTTGYRMYYYGGDQMGAPTAITIPQNTAPGASLDISMNLTAPTDAGDYTGYWRLLNTNENFFGTTAYVQITVGSGTTDTDTVVDNGECTDDSNFVEDVTVPDGTQFSTGETFTKTWRLENDGTCTWDTTYSLDFRTGDQMSAPASVAVTGTVAPGETFDFSVEMVAPATAGDYTSSWRMSNTAGTPFGSIPFLNIVVN